MLSQTLRCRQGVRCELKTVFIEKEILFMAQKQKKFFSGLYHAISRLLHAFFMISYSASPRTKSWKKHAITYIYCMVEVQGVLIVVFSSYSKVLIFIVNRIKNVVNCYQRWPPKTCQYSLIAPFYGFLMYQYSLIAPFHGFWLLQIHDAVI